MRSLLKLAAKASLLLAGSLVGNAFSLLGPFDTWQIPDLNYASDRTILGQVDFGGPMNMGEEYRIGSPVLVYGFDSSFVEFFGQEGVAAVESAVAVLNDLPTVPNMSADLSEYPYNTTHFNAVAQQLRIRDLKSMSMSLLLQQLGLAAPERYTWTLRSRFAIPNTDPQQYTYSVIQRNFDPATWNYSRYINNSLYTYQIVHVWTPTDWSDCQEIGVNVANPNVSVASLAGVQAGATDPRVFQQIYGPLRGVFGANGLYFSGLTRDDVGGLRYLYRSSNTNWQAAPIGATGGGGGGSAGGSPWNIVGFQVVNPLPGSPWTVVGGGFFGFTNTVGTGVIAGNAAPTGGRGGPGKVAFVRVDTDPLLGEYLVPVTIQYPEVVINTQGVPLQTLTQRVISRPDILFTAADVGTFSDDPAPIVYLVNGTTYTYVANPGAGTQPTVGPGILEPGVEIVLNKVGPWLYNVRDTSENEGFRGFVWGSFNGSTNTPIVYPQGATAQELESKLFDQ